MFVVTDAPTCERCGSIVIPTGGCINCGAPTPEEIANEFFSDPGWGKKESNWSRLRDVIRARDEWHARHAATPGVPSVEALPYADVWKWTCHRCGYYVESVDFGYFAKARNVHLDSHARATQAERKEPTK